MFATTWSHIVASLAREQDWVHSDIQSGLLEMRLGWRASSTPSSRNHEVGHHDSAISAPADPLRAYGLRCDPAGAIRAENHEV